MSGGCPELSVIVISYNMGRELLRTLYSLSPQHQQGIDASDYEIIVIDNGSHSPPTLEEFADLGINLRVISFPNPTQSPVRAINHGLTLARAPLIGVSIDGARMASPGLLDACRRAACVDDNAVVTTLSFHIGPGVQWQSMLHGYDAEAEDRLLAGIDWKNNGYRLTDISPVAENLAQDTLGPLKESNFIVMRRGLWNDLGGYDPAFENPGGGAANVDLLIRALQHGETQQVVLLGEAVFHQFHGGSHTNSGDRALEVFKRSAGEYYRLRGKPRFRDTDRIYFGPISKLATRAYQRQLAVGQTQPRQLGSSLPEENDGSARYLSLLKSVLLNETGLETEVALDSLRDTKIVPASFWTETLYNVASRLPAKLDEKRRSRQIGAVSRNRPLAYTMIGRQRLDHLQWCVTTVLAEGIPGDLMECGVWRGGACMLMKAILEVSGDQERAVWLADSYEGLPPPSQPKDEGLDLSPTHAPELAVSQERVKRAFADFGLLDERVRFVPGFFSDTLDTCAVEHLAVLRLDGDLYSSTLTALSALYDRVAPGGFVIIDDYGALSQCARAVEEFRDLRGICDPITMIDWTGAFWRKS